ncbi:MAG: heavy metal translocating P-type ATPase [Halodesulfurarchaeum sp.]
MSAEKGPGAVAAVAWYAFPPIRNALLGGALAAATFIGSRFLELGAAEPALYVVSMLVGGHLWAIEGLEELIEEREVGIEMLMGAAALAAAALGLWEEAAFLVVLYAGAEGLEEYTFARTRASIRGLLDLAPEEATRVGDGEEETVLAAELAIGDVFRVKPGESVPTDGEVIEGGASVDESPVTGESVPVEKEPGATVYAGTVVQDGVLDVRVTEAFEDNTLSTMIHLVEEAQAQKGRSQRFIERFSRVYSPAVLLVGLALIASPLYLGASSGLVTRGIVLLVAAAPCALVMSTPVTIAAGIGRAGRFGVLVKGGVHLENLGSVSAVAFDKTGTLTTGDPVVTDVEPVDESVEAVLRDAAAVEQYSEHPLGRAIVEAAAERDLSAPEASDFESVTGGGAVATVEGDRVTVGSPALLQERGFDLDDLPPIDGFRDAGKTVVVVGSGDRVVGVVALRDEPREDAKRVIEALHDLGLSVAMLTGDNRRTAEAIAAALDIDDVRADLLPEEKVEAVRALEAEHGDVAMVGDGINDAPALAAATVGIAMGAAGSDAAIEAADTALMADDLDMVPAALRLGKRARALGRQNIVFSLLVLAVLIPAALVGVLGVAVAVFVHEGSELLAIANGLRIRAGWSGAGG